MRLGFLLSLFLFLFFNGMSCSGVERRVTPSGVNMMIHDIACREVKDRLIRECHNLGFPYHWSESDKEILLIGPLTTRPESLDVYTKMEENYQVEIKCIDPTSTRISVRVHLKGLNAEDQWQTLKEADRLNAYGHRLLEKLIKP